MKQKIVNPSKVIVIDGPFPPEIKHYCQQCKKDMGFEWILGPVCGKCCQENHKKVAGKGKK